jgi:hypothetical protein
VPAGGVTRVRAEVAGAVVGVVPAGVVGAAGDGDDDDGGSRCATSVEQAATPKAATATALASARM